MRPHLPRWTPARAKLDKAFAVNALGPRHLAEGARHGRRPSGPHFHRLCLRRQVAGRRTSNGTATGPLVGLWPFEIGGRTEVLSLAAGAAVVRTSWVCGRYGSNMVKTVLRLAADAGAHCVSSTTKRGCPTFADDLAAMVVTARHIPLCRALSMSPTRARPRGTALPGMSFRRPASARTGSSRSRRPTWTRLGRPAAGQFGARQRRLALARRSLSLPITTSRWSAR